MFWLACKQSPYANYNAMCKSKTRMYFREGVFRAGGSEDRMDDAEVGLSGRGSEPSPHQLGAWAALQAPAVGS